VVLSGWGKKGVIVDEQRKMIAENYHRFDILQLIDVMKEFFSDENIYFETDPSFAFPPGDVSSVSTSYPQQTTIRLPMMNILGITTPLPIGITDYVNRGRKGADPLQAFLSIMQNRLHHLWVSALRKYNIWRDAGNPAMQMFEMLSARSIEQFEDYDLFWLVAFSRKTRSTDDLKRIIRSIWKNIPVRIEENIGRWTVVENRRPLGYGLRLSRCAVVVGSKVFDRTAKIRISLGPVDINMYKSLLPNLDNNRLLKNIICLYINEPLICELEVLCDKRDLDAARLRDASNKSKGIGGLGRTMVLGQTRGKCENENKNAELQHYRTIILER